MVLGPQLEEGQLCHGKPEGAGIPRARLAAAVEDAAPVQLHAQLAGGCSDAAGALHTTLGLRGTWVRQDIQLPAWALIWVMRGSATSGCE